MEFILDFILHIDQYMINIVQEYHAWTYIILFIIIFCETGLVVTPFLPGDSLLFVTGAIASLPGTPLEVNILVLILFFAAVLGDSCNYMIGHLFGRKLFNNPNSRIFKQSHLDKTHEFYKTLNPQLHSRSATYIKRNGLLIRKITIKSSRPFQCAYHPLTP